MFSEKGAFLKESIKHHELVTDISCPSRVLKFPVHRSPLPFMFSVFNCLLFLLFGVFRILVNMVPAFVLFGGSHSKECLLGNAFLNTPLKSLTSQC